MQATAQIRSALRRPLDLFVFSLLLTGGAYAQDIYADGYSELDVEILLVEI